MKKRYLECGRIVSTHGLRGEVKVQHWCDGPEYLCEFEVLYFDKGAVTLKVEKARPQKNMVLIKLEGYDDIDAAASLRGKIIYLDREDAPEDGRRFFQDILGTSVIDADSGTVYGKISDIIETGANDVYEVTGDDGRKRLVPVIPDVIIETDEENGILKIRPLRGLFDED